jgi:hypothetical protein
MNRNRGADSLLREGRPRRWDFFFGEVSEVFKRGFGFVLGY